MAGRMLLAVSMSAATLTAGSGVASATLPPDDSGGTDFVRREAEAAVTEHFAAEDPVTDVACAPPLADATGAEMLCYGMNGAGNVVTAVATIDDYGGIEVAPRAGGATAPTAPPPAAPDPVLATYQGTGSAVRPVDPITSPTIVRVTHDGAGDFSVQPQHGGVPAGEPLLAVAGGWDGRYLVGLGGTISGFAITADGNWTLELHAISSATLLAGDAPAAGESPDVVSYGNAEAGPVTVEYSGSAPIVVRAVTSAGTAVLVEQPGAFTGDVTLPAGPGNVLVEATGTWTISFPAPPATTVEPATTAELATTAPATPTSVAPTTAATPATSAPE